MKRKAVSPVMARLALVTKQKATPKTTLKTTQGVELKGPGLLVDSQVSLRVMA